MCKMFKIRIILLFCCLLIITAVFAQGQSKSTTNQTKINQEVDSSIDLTYEDLTWFNESVKIFYKTMKYSKNVLEMNSIDSILEAMYKQSDNLNKFDSDKFKKKQKETFISYIKLAESGNDEAQWKLGSMYYYGHGTDKSLNEAFKWYNASSVQGNATGKWMLGEMYENGYGIKQDYDEAIRLYTESALQLNPEGYLHTGDLYRDGKGVDKDYDKAINWYQKSSNQNYCSCLPSSFPFCLT